MTIHIRGVPASTCTIRVAVVLEELKVPYILHIIDASRNEHKSPAHLEHQPFGQVPYIVDDANDNFEVHGRESGLIPGLATGNIEALAKFEQAASTESANFDTYATGLAVEKIYKKKWGQQPDESLAQTYASTLQAKLEGYERILSKSKYLAGDSVSLADLFHLPYGNIAEQLLPGILTDESQRPNVARWWKDITSRPTWLAVKDGITNTA
ncbi:glutathione S-transferase [Panus rudis PR-1116 ss-1]|nr:glutathione S-transferase [Panus rudis PR-1116 ss-1]